MKIIYIHVTHLGDVIMSRRECLYCLESVLEVDLILCSPGLDAGRDAPDHVPHPFCAGCVRRQIEGDAGIGLPDTRCMLVGNCGGRFSERAKDRALTEDVDETPLSIQS